MALRTWLWLSLPALGLVELGGHAWVRQRAPTVAEWAAAAEPLGALRRPGEPVVVAPAWAEPVARHALGDAFFPLAEVARPDDSAVAVAVEVSALGARTPALAGWRVVEERTAGKLTLRRLEQPAPARPTFDFVERARPETLEVAVASAGVTGATVATPCPWVDKARPAAGGLHGHVAFPAQRFQCPGGEHYFVGVTVIEDQGYRPRRCLFAHPPPEGELLLRYRGVPVGAVVQGHAGLSWFLYRDGAGTPVTLAVDVDGRRLGEYTHRDEAGWAPFSFAVPGHVAAGEPASQEARTGPSAPPDSGLEHVRPAEPEGRSELAGPRKGDVLFRVRSASPRDRHFCFHADTR